MNEPSELEREVDQRLDALERFGFPRDAMLRFVNDHLDGALGRLDWLESRRNTASDIEDRIVALSDLIPQSTDQLSGYRERLSDPFEIEEVFLTFERDLRSIASWEPPLNRVRSLWYQAGLEDSWRLLYRRLASLDITSTPAVEPFHKLFAEPKRYDEIFRHLETVEEDEQRQRAVIEKGVAELQSRGMALGSLDDLPLLDALGRLEDWQTFHDERERLRLSVAQLVEPFDAELAFEFTERCMELQHPNRRDDLLNLRDEVGRLAQTLEERRKTLSQRISEWRNQGIVFPHEGELRAGDLLEWETNHDMVEASVKSHLELVERWNRFARYWPSRAAPSEAYVGHLEKTELLREAVEALDNLWKKTELDALDVLQEYENAGLQVGHWRNLVFEDPLSALERLSSTRTTWERRATLLQRLGNLDVSFSGQEDVDVRVQLLAHEELEEDVLDEIDDFSKRFEQRLRRHRTMLEEELATVRRTRGLAEEKNPDRMNLKEFERYLAALQRQLPTAFDPANSGFSRPMQEALEEELTVMAEQGWLIGHWRGLLSESAMDVARSLSQARPYIAKHDVLRRRLLRLPWANDTQLAAKVELMLKQPEQLEVLERNIPAWAAHLANRPTEEEDYTLTAWQPAQPRPTLLPVSESAHPVLRPTTSLDDAHEAMLEAMAEQVPQTPGPETTVEKPSEKMTGEEENKPMVEPVPEHPDSVKEPETPVVKDDRYLPEEETDVLAQTEERDENHVAQDARIEHIKPADDRTSTLPPSEQTNEALEQLSRLLAALNLKALAEEVSDSGLAALPTVRRGLAQHVNVEPRDVRVARLLRLALRLLPENNPDDGVRAALLAQLTETVAPLKRWMRRRLEARHSGARGDFLADAEALGRALERIPGLGKHVPLERDTWPISNDLQSLADDVRLLASVVFLPSAGGVQA